jgi:four helix bundle protein
LQIEGDEEMDKWGNGKMEKKKIESFEDLRVWQKGIELVKQIYLLTAEGQLRTDFGLRDQLQRAAVSIPTNIAEGFERSSRKEYVRFLYIAKGSAGEVRSLLRVALEVGSIGQPRYTQLRESVLELSRYLSNQIHSLKEADW